MLPILFLTDCLIRVLFFRDNLHISSYTHCQPWVLTLPDAAERVY